MGKVFSLVTKPVREFNLESRAHKVISKEKPSVAPRYKADEEAYDRIKRDYPDAYNDVVNKNENLHEKLKNIFVVSKDSISSINPEKKGKTPEGRALPTDKKSPPDYEFGFYEPKHVPYGKVTLRQALRFITDHQTNNAVSTAEKIAEEYKIPQERVENILKYFHVMEMYIPEQRGSKTTFVGPIVPRRKVTKHQRPALPPPNKDDT